MKKTCLEGSVNFVLYIKFLPVRFPRSLDSFASQVNLVKNFIRVSRFLSCNWLSSLHDLSHEDFPNFLDLILCPFKPRHSFDNIIFPC